MISSFNNSGTNGMLCGGRTAGCRLHWLRSITAARTSEVYGLTSPMDSSDTTTIWMIKERCGCRM